MSRPVTNTNTHTDTQTQTHTQAELLWLLSFFSRFILDSDTFDEQPKDVAADVDLAALTLQILHLNGNGNFKGGVEKGKARKLKPEQTLHTQGC